MPVIIARVLNILLNIPTFPILGLFVLQECMSRFLIIFTRCPICKTCENLSTWWSAANHHNSWGKSHLNYKINCFQVSSSSFVRNTSFNSIVLYFKELLYFLRLWEVSSIYLKMTLVADELIKIIFDIWGCVYENYNLQHFNTLRSLDGNTNLIFGLLGKVLRTTP